MPVKREKITAMNTGSIDGKDGIFAGGDCVTGPATVIKAIAGGKVAAANIDEYLGFRHEIKSDIEIPTPKFDDHAPCGRINMLERPADERRNDFKAHGNLHERAGGQAGVRQMPALRSLRLRYL